MRRLLLISALALSACAGNSVRLTTAQALFVAEAGANGANQAATAAAQPGGFLHGPAAAKAKVGLDTANQAVSAGFAAYFAGNSALANAQATSALKNIADVQAAAKGTAP